MVSETLKRAAYFWGALDSVTYAYRREFAHLSYQYFKIFKLVRLKQIENVRTGDKLYSLTELVEDIADELNKSNETARDRIQRLVDLKYLEIISDEKKANIKRINLSDLSSSKLDKVEHVFAGIWGNLHHSNHSEALTILNMDKIQFYWKQAQSKKQSNLYWSVVDAIDIVIRANLKGIDFQLIKILRLIRLQEIKGAFNATDAEITPQFYYTVTALTKEAIKELRQTNVNIRSRFKRLSDLGFIKTSKDPLKGSRKKMDLTENALQKLESIEKGFLSLSRDLSHMTYLRAEEVNNFTDDEDIIWNVFEVASIDNRLPHPTF